MRGVGWNNVLHHPKMLAAAREQTFKFPAPVTHQNLRGPERPHPPSQKGGPHGLRRVVREESALLERCPVIDNIHHWSALSFDIKIEQIDRCHLIEGVGMWQVRFPSPTGPSVRGTLVAFKLLSDPGQHLQAGSSHPQSTKKILSGGVA
eukprot:4319410-Pyramimonas_sp.AAC.1